MSALETDDVTDSIAGKCILVVEDDYVLAREVCNDLKNHGAHVLGPAPTVHYANLIIGKRRLDGAILDIKLFGEEVYSLVDVLQARGVPIVLATAYQRENIDARYRSLDTMQKPLDFDRLREKVASFQPSSDTGAMPAREQIYTPSKTPAASEAPPLNSQDVWARFMTRAMNLKI